MKRAAFILLVLFSVVTFSQETAPIVTDRPTQSAASTVVAKGDFLVEYGFIYEEVDTNFENIVFANFLFRYGLAKGVEFRVTQNILQSRNTFNSDETTSGFSPTAIGTKIHLANEDGWIPQASVIAQVTLENGETAFRPTQAVPEVRFNFSNTLSDNLSIGYNLGMGFPEEDTYTLYTFVLGYAFAEGWTYFIEPYGFFQNNTSDHRVNSGIIYLVSNRLQLDVSAGLGLSEISPNYFLGFGAALGF